MTEGTSRVRRVFTWTAVAGLVLGLGALAMVWRQPSAGEVRPVIGLDVNGGTSIEAAPGSPFVFTIHLTGERRGPVVVGTRSTPWHTSLRLETMEGRELPWRVEPHGTPSGTTLQDDMRLATVRSPSVARLVWHGSHYRAQFSVAPEQTTTFSGAVRVRAVLDTPRWVWWRWRGSVQSQSVTIHVSADAAGRADLQRQRLVETAAYFLDRQRHADAYTAANQVAAVADGVDAQILRGDALAGLNRHAEALAAYRRALRLRPPSYEEPALLLDKIASVSR